MHSSDLLDVVLYNDNLKMFNQACELKLLALGSDLDERVLENWYKRQVKKSTLMKHDLKSAGPCSEKGAEKLPKIEDYGQ